MAIASLFFTEGYDALPSDTIAQIAQESPGFPSFASEKHFARLLGGVIEHYFGVPAYVASRTEDDIFSGHVI